MIDQESPGANCLINIKKEIQVKSEVLGLVYADADVVEEDSNYDLFPTTTTDSSTDTASGGGGTQMDPKKVDNSGRLLGECLSLNKRLVVKLIRLPEIEVAAYAREKTLKMTNKVDPQKGRRNKRSSVKRQKLHNFDGKTTKKPNYHDDDDDQLIKDCQDNSKRLIVVLERIPIIGQTHNQVQNNDVKVKSERLKLGNNGNKYHLKPRLQTKMNSNIVHKIKIICVFCQTQFKDYSSRRTHYENDHKSRWNCKFPNCTESFSCESKNLYVFHQLTHEVEDFKYFWDKKMCPICKEQYDHRKLKEFRKHIISHQYQILIPSSKKSQIKDQFNCDTSGKSFAQKPNLTRHKQLHTKRPTPTPTTGVKCTECDKFLRSKSLQDHQDNFHQIFKCPSDNCTLTFEGKKKYDQHLIREHENDPNTTIKREILSCDLCDKYKTFKKADLRRHKLGLHSSTNSNSNSTTNNPIKCTMCSKTFKNVPYLRSHMSKYHQPFKCTVGDCNKTFKDQGRLDAHVKKHNDKYICHLCSAQLGNFSSNIHSHMITKHAVFTCQMDNCGAELQTETQLLVHQQGVHDPELRPGHLCPTCGVSYWTKKTLDRHRLYHRYGRGNNARPRRPPNVSKEEFENRKCRFCGKAFKGRFHLANHEKYHEKIQKKQKALEESDGPKFPCSYCDKIYTKKKSLIYHTEMNHTKKPIFKCDFEDCDKIFKTNRNLKDHKTSKHLKIKFNCTFCTEIFPTNSALSQHLLKMHKNERDYPFKCDVAGCSESFYRNKYLQDHIDQVHTNC